MQELGSFWEKLIMQVLLGSFVLGDPFHSVNDPKAERAYAYGQYIICRRSTYNKIGGHQSVRDEIVEDHAIARVFKEKGYKIAVADGKPLYSVRMYTNLESLWQGWTKNLYSLIDSRIVNLLCIVFMINMATLTPYLETVAVGAMWLSPESYPYINLATAVVALENLMLIFWFNTIKYHYEGIRWWHFFWVPFGALAVTVLDFHAAYMVLSGSQVNWKGRRYTVNTSKTIQPMVNAALDPALDAAALDGTD
jgi:hypothetical protein